MCEVDGWRKLLRSRKERRMRELHYILLWWEIVEGRVSSLTWFFFSLSFVRWKVTPGGPCSSSCGLGLSVQLVTCVQIQQGKEILLEQHSCPVSEKPLTTIPCVIRMCSYEWSFSEWTEVSRFPSCVIMTLGMFSSQMQILDFFWGSAVQRYSLQCSSGGGPASLFPSYRWWN